MPDFDATSLVINNSAGTPNYMAPEQLQYSCRARREYNVGKPADIWALGCIYHYMAFAATPYHHITDFKKKLGEKS